MTEDQLAEVATALFTDYQESVILLMPPDARMGELVSVAVVMAAWVQAHVVQTAMANCTATIDPKALAARVSEDTQRILAKLIARIGDDPMKGVIEVRDLDGKPFDFRDQIGKREGGR